MALKPQYTCILKYPPWGPLPSNDWQAWHIHHSPSLCLLPLVFQISAFLLGKYSTVFWKIHHWSLSSLTTEIQPVPLLLHLQTQASLLLSTHPLLWSLPLGLHSPCQDYYCHHPPRFTSLDDPTFIQLCRNTRSNLPDLHIRSKWERWPDLPLPFLHFALVKWFAVSSYLLPPCLRCLPQTPFHILSRSYRSYLLKKL